MDIYKLDILSNKATKLEKYIERLKNLKEDEYLNIKINISNFYDFKELDVIQTHEDKYLENILIEYYSKKLEEIKKEIKELVL